MDSMQAEAMRRVREMHSNTPTAPKGNTSSPAHSPPRSTSPTQEESFTPHSQRGKGAAQNPQGRMGANHSNTPSVKGESDIPPQGDGASLKVGAVFADKEKFLILALIMILSSEEQSDPMLTLALLYLII